MSPKVRSDVTPDVTPDGAPDERQRRHWQATLRVTTVLLAIWFVVSFGVAFFARQLSFDFFGWPFSFYMAAQGCLLIDLALIGFYAHHMHRLDIEHGVAEGP